MGEVIYRPYPSQRLLHECPYTEICLEGNRGGGKSDAWILEYLKNVDKGYGPSWAGIIFRQQVKDLRSLEAKCERYVRQLQPAAEYNRTLRRWTFPRGETLYLDIADNEADYWRYHGQELPFIVWDELTSWPNPELYEMMKSCNRCSVTGVPRKYGSSTNPWGAGHVWVKERFIDPAPRLTPITDGKTGLKRVCIHVDLSDNMALLRSDPEYVKQLAGLSNELKRKAWLEGDWNIQIGAFFGECFDKSNIIAPFEVPEHWLKWRSFDWGYAKPFSVGWFCMSDGNELPDGRIYPRGCVIMYREWYGCEPGEADVGLRLTVKQVAEGIRERENENIAYSIADPAIFKEDGGESQGETFAKYGVRFAKADNSRIAGWDVMRERMRAKMFLVFNTCVDFLRIVPTLLHDEKRPEDLDTTMEDHIADQTRYSLMSRPWVTDKAREVSPEKKWVLRNVLERQNQEDQQERSKW